MRVRYAATTVTEIIVMAARPIGKVYFSQMLGVSESWICGWFSVGGVAAWMGVWLLGVGVGIGVGVNMGVGVSVGGGVACVGVVNDDP